MQPALTALNLSNTMPAPGRYRLRPDLLSEEMTNHMMSKAKLIAFVLSVSIAASVSVKAQDSSPGIAIDDQLTIAKCGGCHTRDSSGMMRRLSYIRTSPEVWEQAIKRMVRLNGLSIKPQEAHQILTYLSKNNGLAPEEAKPVFWEAEHRLFRDQSDKIPDDALQHTCNYCHTIGRVLTQRRTHDDYLKLVSMHIGLFPGAENTFKPRIPSGPQPDVPSTFSSPTGGNPTAIRASATVARTDGKYPVDLAVDYLTKNQPLLTPEWLAWKAAMKTPKLDGKWMLIGYQQGKGRVFGTVTIEQGASPDDFVTKTELEYATSGVKFSKTGKGVVYTGYSWRGRSTGSTSADSSADPGTHPSEWREALFVARDGNSMDGRWFWGGYQEFGIDAHLIRIGTSPILGGAGKFALQSPSKTELKIYGANIPADLKPTDLDLGTGIKVTKVVSHDASTAMVEIQVDANLPVGIRDIALRRSTAERAIAVYDKIAYIKVTPDASMARLGGVIAAKQYAQFEAIAYAAGPDGTAQTADDVPLGPVSANWSIEEFVSTPADDDQNFVGKINDSGLFTPNIEGPNPERRKQANNYPTNNWGDVWVAASYNSPGGQQLKARSFLVVTIPVYVRYDQPEVGN
jgi:quinohemoprotein amine dehydrogenase